MLNLLLLGFCSISVDAKFVQLTSTLPSTDTRFDRPYPVKENCVCTVSLLLQRVDHCSLYICFCFVSVYFLLCSDSGFCSVSALLRSVLLCFCFVSVLFELYFCYIFVLFLICSFSISPMFLLCLHRW